MESQVAEFNLTSYLNQCIIVAAPDFSVGLPENLQKLAHLLKLNNEGICSFIAYGPDVLQKMSTEAQRSHFSRVKAQEREYQWSRVAQELSKQYGKPMHWNEYRDLLKKMGYGENPSFKQIKKTSLLPSSSFNTFNKNGEYKGDNPFQDPRSMNHQNQWINERSQEQAELQKKEDLYAFLLLRCGLTFQKSRQRLDQLGGTECEFMSGEWKSMALLMPKLWKEIGEGLPDLRFIPAYPDHHPLLLQTPSDASDKYYSPLKHITQEQLVLLADLTSDLYPKISIEDIKAGKQSLVGIDLDHKTEKRQQNSFLNDNRF